MLLALRRRDEPQEGNQARDLRRLERAGKARHRRPRPALPDEARQIRVGEATQGREITQRGRPNRERDRRGPVAAARRTVARCALHRIQPLTLAHQRIVGAQRRDITGDGPPVLRRQRLFELRHRGARDPDGELAVHVYRGHHAHRVAIGQARRGRPFELARLRSVAAARRAVTLHALLLEDRGAPRERRRPGRIWIQRSSRGGRDPLDQRCGGLRHRIRRRDALDHSAQRLEVAAGHVSDRDRQRPDVQLRLLQELPRLRDLFGRGHAPTLRDHPDRVLLGSQGCRRNDAPAHG